jgi:hypothetical protein
MGLLNETAAVHIDYLGLRQALQMAPALTGFQMHGVREFLVLDKVIFLVLSLREQVGHQLYHHEDCQVTGD